MKKGHIVKQTYFMKNLHNETLKVFQKLHINIFPENISKCQMYFSVTFLLNLPVSLYVKLSNVQ